MSDHSASQQKSSTSVAIGILAVLAVAVGAYSCSRQDEDEVTAYCVTDSTDTSDGFGYSGPGLPGDDGTGGQYGGGTSGGFAGSGDDDSYKVVDDYYCENSDETGYGAYGPYRSYFWYYGGRYSAGRVSGGTRVKPSNTTIVTQSGRTISRGGFGGSSYGGGSRVGG